MNIEDDNYDDDNMRESDAWSDESYENDEVAENDGNTSLYLMVSVCFGHIWTNAYDPIWINISKHWHIIVINNLNNRFVKIARVKKIGMMIGKNWQKRKNKGMLKLERNKRERKSVRMRKYLRVWDERSGWMSLGM